MIRFEPEPEADLKARFRKAVEQALWVRQAIKDPPSGHREHVFDFSNGLRLIISRERCSKRDRAGYIHLSASLVPRSTLWDLVRRMGLGGTQYFLVLSLSYFQRIGGSQRHMELVGVSEGKGVPHWVSTSDYPMDEILRATPPIGEFSVK